MRSALAQIIEALGLVMAVAGVFVLAGPGGALVAAGAGLVVAAVAVERGA